MIWYLIFIEHWRYGKRLPTRAERRKITGCNEYRNCFTEMMPSLLLIFGEDFFNPDWNKTRSTDVRNEARVYLAEQRPGFVVHR